MQKGNKAHEQQHSPLHRPDSTCLISTRTGRSGESLHNVCKLAPPPGCPAAAEAISQLIIHYEIKIIFFSSCEVLINCAGRAELAFTQMVVNHPPSYFLMDWVFAFLLILSFQKVKTQTCLSAPFSHRVIGTKAEGPCPVIPREQHQNISMEGEISSTKGHPRSSPEWSPSLFSFWAQNSLRHRWHNAASMVHLVKM